MLDLQIDIANWSSDGVELRRLRTEVFVIEQGVPPELEPDAADASALHVLARLPDGSAAATGRLTVDGRIGRMAVRRDLRGRGIGDAVLRTLLELARGRGLTQVSLAAQIGAIGFYERHGFIADGPQFDDAGILHRGMQLALEPLAAPPRLSPLEQRAREQAQEIDSLDAARAATVRVLGGARRQVWIYTRDLDAGLYDDPQVLEAFKRLALGGQEHAVRILIQQPAAAVAAGHGLLRLMHRVPTAIIARTPVAEEDRKYAQAFAVSDAGAIYLRPLGSRFDGEARFAAAGLARQLRDYFGEVWERAEPAPELRRLAL